MRLDRYTGDGKQGKYSIIEHRHQDRIVSIGDPVNDFFVIKLKDINAKVTLLAYADQARRHGDLELAADVERLAASAGVDHPHCKIPD